MIANNYSSDRVYFVKLRIVSIMEWCVCTTIAILGPRMDPKGSIWEISTRKGATVLVWLRKHSFIAGAVDIYGESDVSKK